MAMRKTGNDPRTIVSLMGFATLIALLGHTFETKASTSKLSPKVGDAQILLGGTIATVILVLLDQAGDVGAGFSKGVALIALLSSLGFYATPVFKALSNVTGQSTVTPPTTATKATTPARKAA